MNFSNSKIIDISMPITSGMPVYPKNPEVQINQLSTGHSTVSKLTLGTHTGTHADAPFHANSNWPTLDSLPLQSFFGEARVLDFTHKEVNISDNDLMTHKIQPGEIILCKTKNSLRNELSFYEDYIYLDGNGADYLASTNIKLFGIDYLSVKKRGDSDNRSHTSLLSKHIPIIEGLVLKHVTAGKYFFIGFPLNIPKSDGSPLRAVLIS